MSTPTQPTPSGWRLVSIASVVVAALALLGFFAGLRHDLPKAEADAVEVHDSIDHSSAPDYAKLLEKGPIRSWEPAPGIASQIKPPLPFGDFSEEPQFEVAQAEVSPRDELRAYPGAPPTIPHAVAPRGLPCLSCHETGGSIGARVTPPMSHNTLTSCTQCHASTSGGGPPTTEGLVPSVGASTFQGLSAPQSGTRAWVGAPPTIPHPLFMRERCGSCHGINGSAAIKTSHPWRKNCVQCHGSSATLEQQPGGHSLMDEDRP